MHDLQLYIREFACGLFTLQEQTLQISRKEFWRGRAFCGGKESVDDMFNNYLPLFNNIHFASRQLFVN